jgi:hypothetical protein
MKIALIGPGVMPIPPTGWGAVEMLIWDYYTILSKLGEGVVIINTQNRLDILEVLRQNEFDIIHLHYDVFHDIIPCILKMSNGKLIVSSHYPYINCHEAWSGDGYGPVMRGYSKNKDFHIFCSSQKDVDTFAKSGADIKNCWLSRLGVLSSSYKFDEVSTYNKTICFSQICDRKRQYLIQDFDNVDFVGRMEHGLFRNKSNYRGEMPRDQLNEEITKYSNFALLSSVENTTPLVVKEALICGLGVVVSEQVSTELDTDLEFIDVIPEDRIQDAAYIKMVLEKNRKYSEDNRVAIRDYGIRSFDLESILEYEYIPKLRSLL